ncbi:YeeE/YedE family protein [uncultured Thiomicrorhabdus sp.]
MNLAVLLRNAFINSGLYRTLVWLLFIAVFFAAAMFVERPVLLLIGVLIGLVFQYFSFGFANFWRNALVEKNTVGMRSHLLMLAVGGILFFPALALLPDLHGAIRPVGLNVLIGAFLFGIGMALVGSCSSGTIRHMGTLNLRFYWVFLWMVIGGTIAAALADWWQNLASLPSFSMALQLPWFVGLVAHLTVLGFLYLFLHRQESKAYGKVKPLISRMSPFLWAGVLLALLNFVLLLVNQAPWAMSWIFPKLGILTMQVFALPIEWEFWDFTAQNELSLAKPLLQDSIVVVAVGMLLGVFLAFWWQSKAMDGSGLATKKSAKIKPLQTVVKDPAMGGLMGFGAVTAYGCNVGGFFSGIVSGSLHGWVWMFAALVGMSTALLASKWLSQDVTRQKY